MVLPPGWQPQITEDGRGYFTNAITREYSWFPPLPPGFVVMEHNGNGAMFLDQNTVPPRISRTDPRYRTALGALKTANELRASLQQQCCLLSQHVPIRRKWKSSYYGASVDSRRNRICVSEVAHFKWSLVYHGSPSSTGFRTFRSDGVYLSPYLGATNWWLNDNGTFQIGGMESLTVTRNLVNWGWVIGQNSATVYHSVQR
jgi:hypothetical protein